MESHSRSIRRQKMQPREGKKPIQKPLCRLCECPTSDGHVLASKVDRFKLRKWAMEVMNLTEEDENLPEVVEEDALICYFCIWQAEFGDESGDEAVAWWPKNLELEENARVLRENYSVGEVEQCWVQLEEIDLGKYTKKISTKWTPVSGVCLYCGKSYNHLMNHVNYMHKKAIKCGIKGCTTYFHTQKEKEQHMQQVSHEKRKIPCESIKIRCKCCPNGKLFSTVELWRQHMRRVHPELVACTHHGCKVYFRSKTKMIVHINSCHKQGINQDRYLCKHCEYFTNKDSYLRRHEEAKHMPKIFKCDRCDAKFGSKLLVEWHYKKFHTFDKCKSCGQDVSLSYKAVHRRPSVCRGCKLSFECSGLYQSHRKKCKQTLFSCKECGKSFNKRWKLNHHVKEVHTKSAIFRCDHCDYSAFIKRYLQWHMQCKHLPKTIKCEECKKLCSTKSTLRVHKSRSHSFIRCAECAREMRHQNMSKHQIAKTCRRCESKFKCRGLLANHTKSCVPLNSNYFCCDKCPRSYGKKICLYAHIVKKHIDR